MKNYINEVRARIATFKFELNAATNRHDTYHARRWQDRIDHCNRIIANSQKDSTK